MISNTGQRPPLHRRFDEDFAIRQIRERYRYIRDRIERQVTALQNDDYFRTKCQNLYSRGYKDWTILSMIINCMLNWKSQENGRTISPASKLDDIWVITDGLSDVVYPASRFTDEEMNRHLYGHLVAVLKTYGFTIRRVDLHLDVVENFLRVRMRHFEYDLPHEPLFGEPPGDWPKV